MTATTAGALCATSGCGSPGTYLDTTVQQRAAWIEVRTAPGQPGRWYCTTACAAAALHPDAAGSLVLRWNGSADIPGPDDPAGTGCQVNLVTAGGGPAVLVLDYEQRHALASLLDAEVRDVRRPCPTAGCGIDADTVDASDPSLWSWIALQVGGSDTPLRWYCGPVCVFAAVARADDELAEEDQLAAAHGAGTVDDGGVAW